MKFESSRLALRAMKRAYGVAAVFVLAAVAGMISPPDGQAAKIATLAQSIRSDHPRIWMRSASEWYRNEVGTFAWRVLHGQEQPWPWFESPENDQSKGEFAYSAGADEDSDYGADNMYNRYDHDFSLRVLEPLIAGKAKKWNWQNSFQGEWTLDHTADEYFADARAKLLYIMQFDPDYEFPYIAALTGATAYDWLYDETYSTGQPVLTEQDKQAIRARLLVFADKLKEQADGSGQPFRATDVDPYYYVMIGFALYEPSRVNDPAYASTNAKALDYLQAFETDFVGKVLPFWEKQGADGGWHGGLNATLLPYWNGGAYESRDNTTPLCLAPILFAAYTATNDALENSLFNIGMLKYMPEFQLHMLLPTVLDEYHEAEYYNINGPTNAGDRAPWIMPMRAYSRRRFAADLEQLRLAELGAWVRVHFGKAFTDFGSWDTTEQLLFEDKWVNPRDPQSIGFPLIRHFKNLGWVFMRSGFDSPNDLAALFICQAYHWSELDLYAQNALTINYKGNLIKGLSSPFLLDRQKQRTIAAYPSINDGAGRYSPGSVYDVGPGITVFENVSDYAHIVADASHAYANDKAVSLIRQVVFLKPDRFILVDNIKTKSAATQKTWTIQPAASFQRVTQNLLNMQNNGGGALWMKRLKPEHDFVETLNSQDYELTCNDNLTETRIIHVLQVGDAGLTLASPELMVDDAVVEDSLNSYIVKMPDYNVRFDPDYQIIVHRINTSAAPGMQDFGATGAPDTFEIYQNWPNPFNPSTAIALKMNHSAQVRIEIFNISGESQLMLFSGWQDTGMHSLIWSGRTSSGNLCPSGIYFCQVRSEDQVQSRKMMLLH